MIRKILTAFAMPRHTYCNVGTIPCMVLKLCSRLAAVSLPFIAPTLPLAAFRSLGDCFRGASSGPVALLAPEEVIEVDDTFP